MNKSEDINAIKTFLDKVIEKELNYIVCSGSRYMCFVLMGQSIEVLGSFLDNKPMKSKGQSMYRFNKSIDVLFGGRYRVLNCESKLYDKLRNQMTHTFVPSSDVLLYIDESETGGHHHLDIVDGKIIFIAKQFYLDIKSAMNRLISLLEMGKLKPKNIGFR